MSVANYIELYSANRNRQLWPLASNFEVPFAPTPQNAPPYQSQDPVINGTILYKFFLYPSTSFFSFSSVGERSTTSSIVLNSNLGFYQVNQRGFYIGYNLAIVENDIEVLIKILIDPSFRPKITRVVRSYEPTTATVGLDYPLPFDPNGKGYLIWMDLPSKTSMFLPSFDINNNEIDRTEQAYTGYYVVFESYQPTLYSNPDNSNIFYRKISYYDNVKQLIYFDKPLPFEYTNIASGQLFTIRKTLPSYRWSLTAPTYINYQPPSNPEIGPLIGPVLQLPANAPSEDNTFKGKYVYFATNRADQLHPPLPRPVYILGTGLLASQPIPNVFYPIYGAYYIRAYNGTTKQLSIEYDINRTPLPTFTKYSDNSSSLVADQGFDSIDYMGGTTYRGNFTPYSESESPFGFASLSLTLTPDFEFDLNKNIGKTIRVSLRIRQSPNVKVTSLFFTLGLFVFKTIFNYTGLSVDYQLVTFDFILSFEFIPKINFLWKYVDPNLGEAWVEWDLFSIEQVDIINITTFSHDNYSPLFYSGTMVGVEQTVCYNISLSSLSLPNTLLETGSSIAFYPFLYVLIENVTSPTSAGPNLIYSNNPVTSRAVFVVTCYPTPDPSIQSFVSLGSSVSHTLKFKPNDNLRFSVFLSDGKLFRPLVPAILSPYPARIREQIYAVFSIARNIQSK